MGQAASLVEVQLDGIPGPTHHYGGLAPGNLASQAHAGEVAHPRAGALQCLAKMGLVTELGLSVLLLPPLPRPDAQFLQSCGLRDLPQALNEDPELASQALAQAAMWTANAATVVPASDSGDGLCHVIPANLLATPHRALEARPRTAQLRRLLSRCPDLVVHEPLPATSALADEGAANHSRLLSLDGRQVVHLFVHGRGHRDDGRGPRRHPARQALASQQAVARLAGLAPERCLFVRQHPDAIDAGAFHNDVVMVGDAHRVLLHEHSWCDQDQCLAALRRRLPGLVVAEIAATALSLEEAVACYLFNSLLVRTAGGPVLVAPGQCRAGRPRAVIDRLLGDGFVVAVWFVDLDQSMRGGGGPACLRLRLPLTVAQAAALPQALRIDAATLQRFSADVQRSWPEQFSLGQAAGVVETAPWQDLLS